MQQMAALTERAQIAPPVAGGVVIQMSRGQGHFRLSHFQMLDQVWRGHLPAPAIEPVSCVRMLPPATWQYLKAVAMRGRPQRWQIPPSRSNLTCRLSSGQLGGYSAFSSGRIGIPVSYHTIIVR